MDIDEWELLAVDGLLDFHEDGHGGKVYSRRRSCHSRSVLDMDHFRCPSPPANRIVPVTIGLDPEAVEEIANLPAEKAKAPSLGGSGSEREVTPRVFFKTVARDKNEFVDMTSEEATAERESLHSPPRMRGEGEAAAVVVVKDKNDAKCEVGEVLWKQKRSESEGRRRGRERRQHGLILGGPSMPRVASLLDVGTADVAQTGHLIFSPKDLASFLSCATSAVHCYIYGR